jgi:hypothetical protein
MPLRTALLAERDLTESGNASLRAAGLCFDGTSKPRWVKTQRQMEWLTGLHVLGDTLRTLTKANGAVEEMQATADAFGVLTPPEPDDAMAQWLLLHVEQGLR